MNEQRPTFGRALRQSAAAPEPQPVPASRRDLLADWEWDSMRRWVILLLAAPLLILLVESLFSGTELITPLDDRSLWIMRCIGAVDGALLWFLMRTDPAYSRHGFGTELLMFLMIPAFGAAAFDSLAWRVSNWGAFGFSDAAFEDASYAIEYVDRGRKGRRDTISIDPFDTGESAKIPIPRDQYEMLWNRSGDWCVTVSQRRASNGHIQIETDGIFTLSGPEHVPVRRC